MEETQTAKRMKKCSGHKKDGSPCQKWAVAGRDYCLSHGGNRAVGPRNGNYRHGRYSGLLPKGLAPHVEAALQDPNLLSQTEEIALVTGRMKELFQMAQTHGAGTELWAELKKSFDAAVGALNKLAAAQTAGDAEAVARCNGDFRAAFGRTGELIKSGDRAAGLVAEAIALAEPKRRLVESERKRMVEACQVLELRQAAILIDSLVGVIRNHVREPETVRAIGSEFVRILGRTNIPTADRRATGNDSGG